MNDYISWDEYSIYRPIAHLHTAQQAAVTDYSSLNTLRCCRVCQDSLCICVSASGVLYILVGLGKEQVDIIYRNDRNIPQEEFATITPDIISPYHIPRSFEPGVD